jgi:peptidoglycan hydrolase CwlO-like protein
MDTMDAEDDILEELENLERTIEKKDETIKEHREKLEEKDKMIAELQEQLRKYR